MRLAKLSLFNFKNHESSKFEFFEGYNCIVGKNGSGKTNVLDAIYSLSLTKSWINHIDNLNVRHGELFSVITGDFVGEQDKVVRVKLSFNSKERKRLFLNDAEYDRISDHIGKVPLILVEPHDTDYVRLGSELRRKLFDGFIAQLDAEYLTYIIRYKKYLRQRNAALKQMAESGRYDSVLLESFDEEMINLNTYIYKKRKKFTDEVLPEFTRLYRYFSGNQEDVFIKLNSDVSFEHFVEKFKRSKKADISARRTTLGVHKDDYAFFIGENSRRLKDVGSQGQQKSFMIALKLSQISFFKSKLNQTPVLLLDDIFDKLDSKRIRNLIDLIKKEEVQAIITEARMERGQNIFTEAGVEVKFTEL